MLLWINFSWNNKNHKIDGDIKYSYEGWYNCLIMKSWISDLSKTVIETRRCSCIGSCSLIIFPILCERIKCVATLDVLQWKMVVPNVNIHWKSEKLIVIEYERKERMKIVSTSDGELPPAGGLEKKKKGEEKGNDKAVWNSYLARPKIHPRRSGFRRFQPICHIPFLLSRFFVLFVQFLLF